VRFVVDMFFLSFLDHFVMNMLLGVLPRERF